MRRLVFALLALACSARREGEPDAATDVVRQSVAPGQDIELTRQTTIHNQEFAVKRPQAWEALMAAEEAFGMPLESAQPVQGVVVYHLVSTSPRVAGRHASVWIDCGRGPGGGPRVDTYTLSLRLTAVVESVTVDRSRVRMGLVAYARDRSMVTDQLPCTSSGKFEERALAILAAALTP